MKKMFLAFLMMFAGSQSFATTNHDIIQHIANDVILATYNDMATQSAALAAAINNLAANPTDENLAAAQEQWRNTREPWESSEAFLFGPVESLGIDPMIDTWPLNRLDLDNVMKSSRPITTDFIRGLGTNLQGFHTIEYLLFGDGQSSNSKSASSLNSKQLDYLKATSALLAEYTAKLANAWSTNYDPENPSAPGYAAILANPGLKNPMYSSEFAVLTELVKGMMGIADEVANGKIADPMGGDIRSANMDLVESPFSWNSLNDFSHNIRSIYSVYTGTYYNNKGPGIKDLVAAQDPVLAAKVEKDIVNCINLIQAIRPANGGDFGQAIFTPDGRARTQQAVDALHNLFNELKNQVLPLLG
jgi:putative iron-regulated protein